MIKRHNLSINAEEVISVCIGFANSNNFQRSGFGAWEKRENNIWGSECSDICQSKLMEVIQTTGLNEKYHNN